MKKHRFTFVGVLIALLGLTILQWRAWMTSRVVNSAVQEAFTNPAKSPIGFDMTKEEVDRALGPPLGAPESTKFVDTYQLTYRYKGWTVTFTDNKVTWYLPD